MHGSVDAMGGDGFWGQLLALKCHFKSGVIINVVEQIRSRLPVRTSQYALNKWLGPTSTLLVFTLSRSIARGLFWQTYPSPTINPSLHLQPISPSHNPSLHLHLPADTKLSLVFGTDKNLILDLAVY